MGIVLDKKYIRGLTPLQIACQNNRTEVVRYLLDSGADPNYENYPILISFCYVKKPEKVAIVELLIERGADVNATNEHGKTALMIASVHNPPLVELLVRNGADINVVDDGGCVALSGAAIFSRPLVTFYLLENGSVVQKKDRKFLAHAIVTDNENNHTRMIQLLRLAWERGLRSMHPSLFPKITLPSWSPDHHWIYHSSFKVRTKTFLLVWNRMRLQYSALPREIGIMIIHYMASHETKIIYHRCGSKK